MILFCFVPGPRIIFTDISFKNSSAEKRKVSTSLLASNPPNVTRISFFLAFTIFVEYLSSRIKYLGPSRHFLLNLFFLIWFLKPIKPLMIRSLGKS